MGFFMKHRQYYSTVRFVQQLYKSLDCSVLRTPAIPTALRNSLHSHSSYSELLNRLSFQEYKQHCLQAAMLLIL